PKHLVKTIRDAGKLCDQIGPVVIASQIDYESHFNKNFVGPDGAKGISQVPPDAFKKFGKDDDNNGDVSALDPKDSIMAQGRYLCDLADKVDQLRAGGQITGDALNLTLAAYDSGLATVKEHKGVPKTAAAQSYIVGIRSKFAL